MTSKPWPSDRYPTPVEWLEWFLGLDREEQMLVAAGVVNDSERTMECLVHGHAGTIRDLRSEVAELRETASVPALSTSADVEAACFAVESVHHFHGNDCLCGFSSARSRSRTEHITRTLAAALSTPPTEGTEAFVKVTADTLDQWTEDALTQGITPANYVWGVLSAALADPTEVTR